MDLSSVLGRKYLLASASPRRASLLDALGLVFRVHASDVDEIIQSGLTPSEVVQDLARQKGHAMLSHLRAGELMIAADTIVVKDGSYMGKPRHLEEARAMLRGLSGTDHEVLTGVYLSDGAVVHTFAVTTQVTMVALSSAMIDQYLAIQPPLDKAGAYGIQDWIGWAGVSRIVGSYSNVMGLPTETLMDRLLRWEDLTK